MEITIRPIEKKDNLKLAQIIRAVFVEHDAPRVGTVYADASTDICSSCLKRLNRCFGQPNLVEK